MRSRQAVTGQYVLKPDPLDPDLSTSVQGIDQNGETVETRVVTEKPLTLFLNRQEVVTMMTIGDHPDLLAVGYLKNQNMLADDDVITEIEHDDDLEVVIVRTQRETDFEEKLKKKCERRAVLKAPYLAMSWKVLKPFHCLKRPG